MGNVAYCQHVRLQIERSTVRLPTRSMIFAYPPPRACLIAAQETKSHAKRISNKARARKKGKVTDVCCVLRTLGARVRARSLSTSSSNGESPLPTSSSIPAKGFDLGFESIPSNNKLTVALTANECKKKPTLRWCAQVVELKWPIVERVERGVSSKPLRHERLLDGDQDTFATWDNVLLFHVGTRRSGHKRRTLTELVNAMSTLQSH
jgi:hypothetical protein